MINQFDQWLQIFFYSMIPGVEAKFIVPYSIFNFGLEWWQVYPIAIAGNMFLVPVGLKFFKYEEEFLRRYNWTRKIIDRILSRIRIKTDKKVQRYKSFALIFFVALPIPMTGAGLGVVIAYLFDFKFKASILMIFIGVLISTSITTTLYITGTSIF